MSVLSDDDDEGREAGGGWVGLCEYTGHSVVIRPHYQPQSQSLLARKTSTVQTYKNNKEMETIRKLLPAFKVS